MSNGSITRRGKTSWRIKYEAGRDPNGKRITRYQTIPGTKRDAQKALTDALHAVQHGTDVEPSKVTVAAYIRTWLTAPSGISPKTLERYRQLAEQQIYPFIGQHSLQKLAPGHVQDWHTVLLARGGKNGRSLHPRTVGHAHRVLHRALARAVEGQRTFRNVASVVKPPKVEEKEIQIVAAGQISDMLKKLRGHALFPVAVTAIGTGMRRGELLALRWLDVDLGEGSLRVERSIEETNDGLRFKAPKSRHGRRTVAIPPMVVETLREHRREQLETRLVLGLGKHPEDALVFCLLDGSPMSPDKLSRDWANLVTSRKLPRVSFHGLRHTHASALIAAGLDVVSVSRRIGHGSPALTLKVYAHLFSAKDTAAVDAIEAALRG